MCDFDKKKVKVSKNIFVTVLVILIVAQASDSQLLGVNELAEKITNTKTKTTESPYVSVNRNGLIGVNEFAEAMANRAFGNRKVPSKDRAKEEFDGDFDIFAEPEEISEWDSVLLDAIRYAKTKDRGLQDTMSSTDQESTTELIEVTSTTEQPNSAKTYVAKSFEECYDKELLKQMPLDSYNIPEGYGFNFGDDTDYIKCFMLMTRKFNPWGDVSELPDTTSTTDLPDYTPVDAVGGADSSLKAKSFQECYDRELLKQMPLDIGKVQAEVNSVYRKCVSLIDRENEYVEPFWTSWDNQDTYQHQTGSSNANDLAHKRLRNCLRSLIDNLFLVILVIGVIILFVVIGCCRKSKSQRGMILEDQDVVQKESSGPPSYDAALTSVLLQAEVKGRDCSKLPSYASAMRLDV